MIGDLFKIVFVWGANIFDGAGGCEMFAPPAWPNRCPTVNYTRPFRENTLRAFQNGVGGCVRWCVAPARGRPVYSQRRLAALYSIQYLYSDVRITNWYSIP